MRPFTVSIFAVVAGLAALDHILRGLRAGRTRAAEFITERPDAADPGLPRWFVLHGLQVVDLALQLVHGALQFPHAVSQFLVGVAARVRCGLDDDHALGAAVPITVTAAYLDSDGMLSKPPRESDVNY